MKSSLEPLIPEVLERQQAVIESGRYVLGPELEAFEAEFATYLDRGHCIGVGSGTEALTIALRAMGVGPGDQVVVPALSFFATAEAVVNAGAVPTFADIDPGTWCLTAETAEPAITERTRAILPVHLFGNVAPMTDLNELAAQRGLSVLEDAAQAAGARLNGRMAGSWGTASSFSFYPSKNLPAFGDGGAIVTDDDSLAKAARRLRNHCTVDTWVHAEAGYNSRLDELQAAALRVMLPQLDGWTTSRRHTAQAYRAEALGDLVTLPVETMGAEAAFHLFVILAPNREALASTLAEAGIEARPYYTTTLHHQPAMMPFANSVWLPNAEHLASQGLALPMGPALDRATVHAVVTEIRHALS